MSTDAVAGTSRRAVLAAAAGAAAAAVATAIERPLPALAADNDVVQVGHTYDSTMRTQINSTDTAIFGQCTGEGYAGVVGEHVGPEYGFGVQGHAEGSTGYGVIGSGGEAGVRGLSAGQVGVAGTGGTGVRGEGSAVGVEGIAGQGGIGVVGVSPVGTAIRATSTSGTALDVVGKAKFSRARRVTIGAGKSSLKVTLAGVTTSSLVLAVLHSNRSGVFVRAVVPATGSFTIYLNTAPTSATYVAYFVIN